MFLLFAIALLSTLSNADADTYILGARAVDDCPTGSYIITTASGCEAAISWAKKNKSSLVHDWHKSSLANDWAGGSGAHCYLSAVFQGGTFLWSVNFNPDSGDGAWYICNENGNYAETIAPSPDSYHKECWSAFGCEDGATVCSKCGLHDGKEMYCCNKGRTYADSHACKNSAFASHAYHHCVTNGEAAVDKDCEGKYSACTKACELAADRTFTETQAKSGNGKNCPVTEDCKSGDGECVDNYHKECWGAFHCWAGTYCVGCGLHDSKQMYCCNKDVTYAYSHACKNSAFASSVDYHCVTKGEEQSCEPAAVLYKSSRYCKGNDLNLIGDFSGTVEECAALVKQKCPWPDKFNYRSNLCQCTNRCPTDARSGMGTKIYTLVCDTDDEGTDEDETSDALVELLMELMLT
jgi:hypothetical protein